MVVKVNELSYCDEGALDNEGWSSFTGLSFNPRRPWAASNPFNCCTSADKGVVGAFM